MYTVKYRHNWFRGTVQARVDKNGKVGYGKGKTEDEARKNALKNLKKVRR